MDLKQLVMMALQVSILSTVFSFGLKATTGDLLYVLRRPGLLGRSLLAMFVVVPVLAVILVLVFHFKPEVEVLVIALAISPVPPLLPQREQVAGGHIAYGLGLMAMTVVLSLAVVPLELAVLQRVFDRATSLDSRNLLGLVFKAAILPLLTGMLLRALAPTVADRLAPIVATIAKILLLLGAVGMLAGTYASMLAQVGGGTVVAFVIFVLIGLTVGHLLGGPDPDHAAVLALSTSCRHPAIAFAIASANDPNHSFGPLVILYLLVNVIVALPYLVWRRKAQAANPAV